MPTIEEVVSQHQSSLADLTGVTLVGQGKTDDKDCILVWVEAERYLPDVEAVVPPEIDGYPVVFQVSGELRPHPRSLDS